jgi:steroid delta-isomerase-like uncharacterized protein
MSELREIVRRFHEAAWTEGQLDEAARLLAPDLVDHDAIAFPGRSAGAAGLLQVVGMIRSAIPDLRREIRDQLVVGETVVTRFGDIGTHQGDLMGIPPTGRHVEVRGINIERVQDGRITELWHLEDVAGLMAQITGEAPAASSPMGSA